MKKNIISIFTLICLLVCSCNSEKKGETHTSTETTVQTSKPMDAEKKLKRNYTVDIDGNHYNIIIERYPDHSLPTVKDQLEQEFYDNSVKILITRNNQEFFSKIFKKEAFIDYMSEEYKNGSILLGMAFDKEKTNKNKICIAAQLGQPGTGEGPAFTVEIITSDASCSIIRDLQQDTNAENNEEFGD